MQGQDFGEGNTDVRIRIVRLRVVDVRAIRIELADIDELTIGITAFPLHVPIRGNGALHFLVGNGLRLYKHVAELPHQERVSSLLYIGEAHP